DEARPPHPKPESDSNDDGECVADEDTLYAHQHMDIVAGSRKLLHEGVEYAERRRDVREANIEIELRRNSVVPEQEARGERRRADQEILRPAEEFGVTSRQRRCRLVRVGSTRRGFD